MKGEKFSMQSWEPDPFLPKENQGSSQTQGRCDRLRVLTAAASGGALNRSLGTPETGSWPELQLGIR
ncbi:hypothetical protein OIU85_012106, partial [Salix viminalis]